MEIDNDDTGDVSSEVFDLPPDHPFDLPKEYETGDRLLLTGQIKRLAEEIDARRGQQGVAENCFILAGPSGIGKSGIALYIAMHLFLKSEVVLYINDAGGLVGEVERCWKLSDSGTNKSNSAKIMILLIEFGLLPI